MVTQQITDEQLKSLDQVASAEERGRILANAVAQRIRSPNLSIERRDYGLPSIEYAIVYRGLGPDSTERTLVTCSGTANIGKYGEIIDIGIGGATRKAINQVVAIVESANSTEQPYLETWENTETKPRKLNPTQRRPNGIFSY